jgi:AraC family transcriptional activator of pobA
MLLWFQEDGSEISIDSIKRSFNKDEITCLTAFDQLEVLKVSKINVLKFNKPFYCVVDHDSEVGCKGILYYGATILPLLKVENDDLHIIETA